MLLFQWETSTFVTYTPLFNKWFESNLGFEQDIESSVSLAFITFSEDICLMSGFLDLDSVVCSKHCIYKNNENSVYHFFLCII